MRLLVDYVEDLGVKAGQAVIAVPRSAFKRAAVEGQELREAAASRLLDELIFRPRARWRDTPPGFEPKDPFPWRFRRRLSVLRRPLLQIDEGEDPTILVAPGMMREAFVYSAGNFLRGDFPDAQLSPRMRAWRAKTVAKRGTILAEEVAGKLKALTWSTRTEINVTEVLRRGLDRDYGDIDVLAWRHDMRRVLVIECKDVQYGKTEGEIAEQLADFRGEIRSDGRRDELRKHLDRMEVIRDHLSAVSQFTGIEALREVESHLLFRHPVPMKFALSEMSEKVRVSHLEEIETIHHQLGSS
jgi:hypothetical protein